VNLPWIACPPLEEELFEEIRLRTIFDCCKWDPQVEDVSVLARTPLILGRQAWDQISRSAERLAAETLAAEAELGARFDLHGELGLSRAVRSALRRPASAAGPRVIRFDFHFTTEGWWISEANTDVPGGFIESSGFTRLVGAYVEHRPAGDPAAAYCEAILRTAGRGARVGLVHATAYTDDRQVMTFLARALERAGARAWLIGPDQFRWRQGEAHFATEWAWGRADALLRFFPAEWLPNLPRRSGWEYFFGGARTPLSNPASALLTQSKRFPLVWDRLETPLPEWRRLPEIRDPLEAGPDWVLKPALGRVGTGVGIPGVTAARDWAAQRRFEIVPLETAEGSFYPCLGVFVIDGRVAGAYGRLASRQPVDHLAQDTAVLVACREPITHAD
jgi:hypothetical protein